MLVFLVWGLLAALFGALGVGIAGSKRIKRFVHVALGSFLVGGFLGWLFLPTLNLHFYYLYFSSLLFYAVGFVAACTDGKDDVYYDRGDWRPTRTGLIASGVLTLAFIGYWFFSTTAMVNSASYHALLGQPRQTTPERFSADLAPIDTRRLRQVNAAYAAQLADKMLGEQQGLGSQVNIDTMNISQMNGCFRVRLVGTATRQQLCFEHELVWVAPLVHSGFFRWLTNGTTHGFALVSAGDPSKRYLIDEVNGTPVSLRYQVSGAYFGDDLKRHLRSSGYLTSGLTDFNFELDDQGRPFWIAVRYERRIGFSGEDPVGVLVVDPATGDIQSYDIADTPGWVDRAQPADITLAQFDYWGIYGGGWLNSWTSRTDMIQTSTDELHLVEGRDGRTYWYTGIASMGQDNSTTGFVLIDTRTRAVRMYHTPGATEAAAQTSAQNTPLVRERSYAAAEPVLYNLNGHATYFMTLGGDDNVPRMFAFVSVRDFQVVGVGQNIESALRTYEAALRNVRRTEIGQRALPRATSEGIVARIVRDGDNWALLLSDETGAEYYIPANISPEVKYTQSGDRVRLIYEQSPERNDRAVTNFNNLGLDLVR